MNTSIWYIILAYLICNCIAYDSYPVPTPPGGRMAVHGWLILPIDQPHPKIPTDPVYAWFVHHTPVFFTHSPHDFQIILYGSLVPLSVAENRTLAIDLPYPPAHQLVVDEFTITPPPPFSLNDLLNGNITQLLGVVYNGSFDTLYERIPMAIANFDILNLTTAVWLNYSHAIPNYPQLRYYSYPRKMPYVNNEEVINLYMSHEIHSPPDFDQVVHIQLALDNCTCDSCDNQWMSQQIQTPSAVWEFDNIPNNIDNRLMPDNIVTGRIASSNITCNQIEVLEEIHCVVGPAFFKRCASPNMQ